MVIEYIEWLDSGAHLSDGWMKLEAVARMAPSSLQTVVTVGQLVHEDDEVVVLGLTVDESNAAVYGCQVIAKSCVRRRGRVEVAQMPPGA